MYKQLHICNPLTDLTSPHVCFKPGPGFSTSYVFGCIQWLEERGGCSFCLYWWNC